MPSRRAGFLANRASLRGATPALWVAALLTLVALVGLGTSLHDSQTSARETSEGRFTERAMLSAALIDSLFASSASASQARNAQLFGSARVSAAALGAEARRGRLSSLVLLRADGTTIARSPDTPDAVRRAIAARPAFVRAAPNGDSLALSDVTPGANGHATIHFAQPFDTPSGRRVLVSGLRPQVLYEFIGCEYGRGYLFARPTGARELEPTLVAWDPESFAEAGLRSAPPAALPGGA